MNVHPFLQKQGIDSVQLYPDFAERVKKDLHEIWKIEQVLDVPNLPFTAHFIIGNDHGPNFFMTIKDKQVNNVTGLMVPDKVLELKQHMKYLKSISFTLAKNKGLRAWFHSLITKWEIPRKGPYKFFRELSGGRDDLFLPYVIRDEELIYDINELCDRLNLRKEIPEEFWTVSAYLLFRNTIDYVNLHYIFIESEGLFKIQTDNGYQLFLKLNRTLNWNLWVQLSKIINGKIREEKGFIPGDGIIFDLIDLINNIPEWCTPCKVYSIPAMFDQCWTKEYNKNREAISNIYSRIRTPRVTTPRKKTNYVITKLNEKISNKIKIDSAVLKEIAREVDLKYDQDGKNKDKPYSEDAVYKVYTRYVIDPETRPLD